MSFYQKYNMLSNKECKIVVDEIFRFKQEYYTQENLKEHVAYLADDKPGRYSHAYAINCPSANKNLPGIAFEKLLSYPMIARLTASVSMDLKLDLQSRFLFNIQEYYSDNAEVPKHFDGELLDFDVTDKELLIKEAVRPHQVAVLTIVNDVGQVGTRVHYPDNGSIMVDCQAGEVLIFDNLNCHHSVDAFGAKSKRKDKLIRLIIGWRSLNTNCSHYTKGKNHNVTTFEANSLIEDWYKNKWPQKWKEIEANQKKAAF